MNLDKVIEGLNQYGIQYQPHTQDGLLQHLKGTYQILSDWQCSQDLCLAGLCHSIYGTESYQRETVPLSERSHLQDLIGKNAERTAYFFGAHVKESLWKNLELSTNSYSIVDRFTNERVEISQNDFNDLVTLTLANWLEQRPRAPQEYQFLRRREFLASKEFLPIVAFDEFKRAYGIS